jgi:hypothetical protein
LVPGPGDAWVGSGVAFKDRLKRQPGTLVVVWGVGHVTPWVLFTDVAPQQMGVCW